jgi:hypothetical protein
MLKILEGKNVAIIGYQTGAGRVILKKMMQQVGGWGCCEISVIEVGKDQTRRSKLLSDSYFTEDEKQMLRSKVKYVALDQLSQMVKTLPNQRIDILFSLF